MDVRQVLPPDAIPSVDDPRFVEAYDGPADDEVLALDLAGEARAYPIRYLHYHEIVNDRVGETPVAITWCPLCGSAVVYERTVDGRELEFGVSGKLADDDLVMYDRETESEWKQSLGRCIAGAFEGRELRVLPASMTTWARFRESNPEGVVLAPPGGRSEAASDDDTPVEVRYDANPYEAYFERDGFGLGAHRGESGRSWDRDDLDPKGVVLGVEAGGAALGFPLPDVAAAGGVVTATVGGTDVVVFAADGIHAFENPGYEFAPVADGGREDDADEADDTADADGTDDADEATAATGEGRYRADGATWDGATGESDDGRALDRLPARRLFAFAWQDDHGPDAFYGH